MQKELSTLLFSVLNVLDVNECTNGTHNCDDDATCQNHIGSFNCSCNSGYDGNGTTCFGMTFIEMLCIQFFMHVINMTNGNSFY